ncbi:hypothetical protein M433DRAFT_402204 [Acidomyces richmondensis BFW]|nr:MAG: hypothetical protein FE78DRAFT_205726 [Acidomyces sp. 'richmondensis']KYG48642.1 hypothetical protein M433DRAFT_402204 [Acidomyces richmondensis BFW]
MLSCPAPSHSRPVCARPSRHRITDPPVHDFIFGRQAGTAGEVRPSESRVLALHHTPRATSPDTCTCESIQLMLVAAPVAVYPPTRLHCPTGTQYAAGAAGSASAVLALQIISLHRLLALPPFLATTSAHQRLGVTNRPSHAEVDPLTSGVIGASRTAS